MTLAEWADLATILGAIVGVVAIVYTASQIRQNTRAHRAEFWLTLRGMLTEHQTIHRQLRDYEWSNDDAHYPSEEEWAQLEAYMGLMEHCEIMLEDGMLDWLTFRDVYGYRIRLILKNPLIVRDTLIRRRDGWLRFIELVRRMKGDVEKSRYLCGFSERFSGTWTLWWGYSYAEEGCSTFSTWSDLEEAYHAKLAASENDSKSRIDYAWLIRDREVVHSLVQADGRVARPFSQTPG
jgi:hypothetical protein